MPHTNQEGVRAMFFLPRRRQPAAPSRPNRIFSFRPVLEVLEDRSVLSPVAIPALAPAAGNTEFIAGLLSQPGSPTSAGIQLPLHTAVGQPQAPEPSLVDQPVLGFSGRIVFPGTALQERSGTGSGPLSQPPGLFLVGGSGAVPLGETTAPPRLVELPIGLD
jgi:hypothetical protein